MRFLFFRGEIFDLFGLSSLFSNVDSWESSDADASLKIGKRDSMSAASTSEIEKLKRESACFQFVNRVAFGVMLWSVDHEGDKEDKPLLSLKALRRMPATAL